MDTNHSTPQLLNAAEVSALLRMSESQLGNLVQAGDFDEPMLLGTKKLWALSSVEQYIAQAAAIANRATNLKGNRMSVADARSIPLAARVHGPLQAYDSEQDAYLMGNWALAKFYGSVKAEKICLKHGLRINGSMSGDDNSKGGHTVPVEMQRAIIRIRESRGVFPRYANRVPMGSDTQTIPRMLTDATASWASEAVEVSDSTPTLGSAELNARKLIALTKISSEVDEDASVDVGEAITLGMGYSMADKVDEAAFNGDGSSTYGGHLGLANALDSAAIQVAASGNTGADTIDASDLEATMGLCGDYAEADARWYMHRKIYFALARLMSAAGSPTTMVIDGVLQPILCGYPVTFVQVMPSTTTALVSTLIAYFGDLRLGSSYGVRRSQRTEISSGRFFENDQLGVKSAERIAINIHERGDTADNRPIVALKTAAS